MNTHTTPLYELTAALSQLWEETASLLEAGHDTAEEEAANGFDLAAIELRLKALEGTHAQKALDIACLIKNVEAEGEMVKVEEARLKARRQSTERKAEWLRTYLASNMEPGTNLRDGRAAISWRNSQAVEVTVRPEELPAHLQWVKTIVEPNKEAIKINLEAGQKVEGCTLATRYNLQIK